MASKIINELTVTGGNHCYGEIELQGDAQYTIFLIANFLVSSKKKFSIKNACRAPIVQSYLEFLEKIGVTFVWDNSYDLTFEISNEFKGDLTQVESSQIDFVLITIPAFLYRKGQVTISRKVFSSEINFYTDLGVFADYEDDSAILTLPLDNDDTHLHLELVESPLHIVVSRILLKRVFRNLKIIYDEYDYRFDALKEEFLVDNSIVPFSPMEFSFYATLSVLTEGEISISNYSLDLFLPFLLNLVELGGSYEVVDNRIKVWIEKSDIEPIYNFTHVNLDELGYFLLILSKFAKEQVRINNKKTLGTEKLIRELNMIGAEIDYVSIDKPDGEYLKIFVKPAAIDFSLLTLFPTQIEINLVLFVAAFTSINRCKVDAISNIEKYFPFIRENIANLSLDLGQ